MPLHKCENCLDEFPIEQFPNLQVGMICSSCMKGDASRRAERAIKDKAQSLAGQLSSLDGSELAGADTAKVRQILGDIYGSFGGTTSFANHLHWVIMELCKRRPIPTAVGQLMVNLMKLHHQVESQEEQTAAREMSDEQLRRETELAAMRLFVESASDADRRKMVERVLGKHGLVITEANSDQLVDVVDAQ
jgi:hypothetical protein